ncbi:MAG: hypothetical protein EPN88_01285 [Bacteroidetes bacterium]|nr:MAG: hypothetical protein EPN88_01285 [Bacteroidota bacterium]
MKKYCQQIRTLHIYFGLFISPFILIYSISVLAYNHAGFLSHINTVKSLPEIRTRLDNIPYDTTDLLTAQAIIRKIGIKGEIDFIINNADQISFPVNKPGLKTRVEVNTHTDSVVINRQLEGSIRAMNYLHIMPGQHNAKIRGNSLFLKIWRLIADLVVYLLLFLVLSGIFLWYLLEFERNTGFYAIILGMLFFTGLLFLII